MNLLDLFSRSDDTQEFAPGTSIFEQGAPGNVMYVVLSGEVEVRVNGRIIDAVRPGELLGEMALIDVHQRSATAVAKTHCRLAPVDEKRFLFMVQQTPFFSLHVMRVLAERLRRMNAHLAASLHKESPGEIGTNAMASQSNLPHPADKLLAM